jgi:hypothetical protein
MYVVCMCCFITFRNARQASCSAPGQQQEGYDAKSCFGLFSVTRFPTGIPPEAKSLILHRMEGGGLPVPDEEIMYDLQGILLKLNLERLAIRLHIYFIS